MTLPVPIRTLLLAVVTGALAAPLPAQSTPSPGARVARAVDSMVFKAHLEFLADDALEGRAPGTRGGLAAQKYIAAQFERLGLEPAGDSGTYFQRVPIIALTPEPTLAVAGAGRDAAHLEEGLRPVVHAERFAGECSPATLVFVGYGIVAPEDSWNDYAGLDVKGKIVVALVNDPGLQDSTIFRGKILTYYGRWTYKIEEARRQGAAGILHGPHHRERDLSVDHRALGLDRAAGSAGDAAELAAGRRLAAAGRGRAALPGRAARTWRR